MTTSLPGIIALRSSRAPVRDRVRADPAHHEGGDMTVTPVLLGGLAALCVAVGLLADPAAARPRADRAPAGAGGATRAARGARSRAAGRVARGAARPAAGAGHARHQARGDRPPAGPRRPPRRDHRAALHRLQGGRACCSAALFAAARRSPAARCCWSCSARRRLVRARRLSRAPAGCARSGSSATCRTSSTSSP